MATIELSPGIHDYSLDDFIKEYCITSDSCIGERWCFAEPLNQIYEWANSASASYILIGGSFVSSRENPSDIDLIVVFKKNRNIQKCPESLLIREMCVDIQYLSEEDNSLLDAFIYLLAYSKSGQEKGIARIAVSTSEPAPVIPSLQPALYETVRDVYEGRTQLLPHSRKGIIIPIHGVNTNARWLSYFSLLASNAGWGIAPFVYGREWFTTLVRQGRREQLAEQLRMWLITVRSHYKGPVAIFGHSLGAYIFAKYLEFTNESKESFSGVVLAGSILNTGFDWPKHLDSGRISALYNTYSSRDNWVKKMPDGGPPFFRDPLYGNAGHVGFYQKHNRFLQYRSDILNHVNVFENDEIKRWLDFFEVSLKLHTTTPLVRESINLEHVIKRAT
ncbi:hypothetical protein Q6D67_19965 [Haliea sp. E1-2-M8]|uniref:DUF6932 family protein n=1 Tax=Haliea sp. E1-2-M8 TaxID=3064706 RepID=UPI0027259AA2|nr:hypothetical protein [Haliea sp. E1-2-M8]MDO8863967.1 hypothetical protein [Haliea sp. E1-2-M8]